MPFGFRIVVAVLLFVGAPVSGGELQVNGFPTDANFFPIGVWLQSPTRAASYKAIGINTFVGLYEGPTEEQLAALARQHMFAIAGQNDVALKSVNRHVIKAWMQEDEPDNAQPIGPGVYGTCIPAIEVARRTREMKARDPTRPIMINFGQGVANEFWRGRGPCNGDQGYYDIAIQGADLLSYDIYPVGSTTPQVKGRLEYVARGVTNLAKRATDGQSVWMALETTALDPTRRPTAAEVRAEIWMALVHGATGIFYFVHEFKPTFREDAIFRYPDIVEEVTKTNRLILSLSPALKSPSVSGAISVSSQVPIATMVKVYKDNTYIFAVAMQNSPSTARITVNNVHQTSARVIGEGRSVSLAQGSFEDQFEGYGVHLYQIP
ncbi:hypothetical protein [Bradyrhizobium vignae]|uniref:Glycoside hydrolase family 42 N-terminal domain-containing protein n=1 Tax=Bradyrhizobium vignae TaxID=1549949 RepID=A0ABS4A0J2_9BRAD|nr:hypothetical protein [Bradyrhizobium vignae]MBP0113912.1 hypothetical protein [Bradyrhizobium vignae]RXG88279.1 hypothetical protein EAV90_31060 [Bradyrhizobium vignae]